MFIVREHTLETLQTYIIAFEIESIPKTKDKIIFSATKIRHVSLLVIIN